ncbi:MAG TPA: hypothetical protein DD490_11450 [Acidobacteria bacterium]|nr:hypothetical protein [Acidobacteriota bacterium]
MQRTLACLFLMLVALCAAPAGAEVYFVTLNNGTTFETAYQPQAASWDPGMVLLLTEQGNWIGLPQVDIREVRSESQIAGYGRVIDSKTFELGMAPNDAEAEAAVGGDPNDPNAANAARTAALERMVEQQQQEMDRRQAEQSYTIKQFVDPSQLQGIPGSLIGTASGSRPRP